MHTEELVNHVKHIVTQAQALKDKYTQETNAPVNYACVFSQTKEEYETLLGAAQELGVVIDITQTGLVFQIKPMETSAGVLKLLKIRIPDPTRTERGDADFTVSDFSQFEKKYVNSIRFKRIEKEDFIMIELTDPEFNVRTYFSNPTLENQLRLT